MFSVLKKANSFVLNDRRLERSLHKNNYYDKLPDRLRVFACLKDLSPTSTVCNWGSSVV